MVSVVLLLVPISLIWRHNNGGYPVLMGTYTILPQIRLFQRYLFYFLPTVTTRSFLHWFLAISFLRYEYDQEKLPNCPTITETNHLMTSWNKTKIILRQLVQLIDIVSNAKPPPPVLPAYAHVALCPMLNALISGVYTYIYTYTKKSISYVSSPCWQIIHICCGYCESLLAHR